MRNVVIAGAVRTAIGRFGGTLVGHTSVDLGEIVVRDAVARAGLAPEDVEEVILGNVLQACAGSNVARQVLLRAGIPDSVPAFTVNKVCASGMKAIALAALSVSAGEQAIVVAGGVESMSNAPYLLAQARRGYTLGDGRLLDSILTDALTDPLGRYHMGMTAEHLATEYGISRQEQDAFAAESQQKAARAIDGGYFEKEIVPVSVPQRKGPDISFVTDEHPRPATTVESLGRLQPAFQDDGTVTAGNSSGINDGAAALVLMAEEAAQAHGIVPLARIRASASAALDPRRMGIGPVDATQRALNRAGVSLSDIGVVELNEAFAAQSLAVLRELYIESVRVNVAGGAIALGHPVGASGARIVVTLLHTMERLGEALGLATLCVGGGQGMALVVERTA